MTFPTPDDIADTLVGLDRTPVYLPTPQYLRGRNVSEPVEVEEGVALLVAVRFPDERPAVVVTPDISHSLVARWPGRVIWKLPFADLAAAWPERTNMLIYFDDNRKYFVPAEVLETVRERVAHTGATPRIQDYSWEYYVYSAPILGSTAHGVLLALLRVRHVFIAEFHGGDAGTLRHWQPGDKLSYASTLLVPGNSRMPSVVPVAPTVDEMRRMAPTAAIVQVPGIELLRQWPQGCAMQLQVAKGQSYVIDSDSLAWAVSAASVRHWMPGTDNEA